ncbi:ABC transporter ATP-binding protein [Erysipelotrichaceae bacterium RD49]|nr:ABC transporter ATP-binding protein [Erysipelotrichaceae bacterium RD49]
MIEINHVTKRFGDKTAVKDLSVVIPDGTITGFIGPNGAGKTTTINMMTGILQPDAGEILLDGHNIVTDPIEAKKSFVLVPDSPDIFLRLTGREYIKFMGRIYDRPIEQIEARMEELAKEFELESSLDEQMNSYSHGMRQKAIVIGALVCDPQIWFLDEPMTGLDPTASYILKEKMREQAAKGKTIFFSTHVLEVAEKLCDKILLIDHGDLKYNGTLEALKEQHPDCSLEEIFIRVTGHE